MRERADNYYPEAIETPLGLEGARPLGERLLMGALTLYEKYRTFKPLNALRRFHGLPLTIEIDEEREVEVYDRRGKRLTHAKDYYVDVLAMGVSLDRERS